MDAYRELEERYRRTATLSEIGAVLHWDRSTVMPDGGATSRAEQMATLELLVHERRTDPRLGELLEAAAAQPLDVWQQANLREMKRAWTAATALPAELVEALSRCTSASEMAWRSARAENDFAALAPALTEVVARTREAATAMGEAKGLPPYDALLDGYDPGRRRSEVEALFAEVESFLPDLLTRVLERQAGGTKASTPKGPYPAERQAALGERFMRVLGFDFAHGRLDTSHHPFTGGTPDDVRITTRYDESDFLSGLMAVIHETGHAQYERGLPREWRGQPVGDSRGMTIHESQSLLFEMQVGRSREFLGFALPVAREVLGADGDAWDLENLVRVQRRVERGLIRVEADEVTYPLHVILRTRLEIRLIEGDLEVSALPAAWSEEMRRLIGVAPPDDTRGCLQDIHWPAGAFGYFPTYTLGALAAAQLFDAARRAAPEISSGVSRGDFGPLLAWLAENIHSKGCLLWPGELIEQATGAPLSADVFRRHLESRYLEDA